MVREVIGDIPNGRLDPASQDLGIYNVQRGRYQP